MPQPELENSQNNDTAYRSCMGLLYLLILLLWPTILKLKLLNYTATLS
jgi:hypothetical protein